MRKSILIILGVLLLASCSSSLAGRFSRLADKVEAKGSDFSVEQWEKANAEFEGLVEEYSDHYRDLKPSEKKEINAAIARYGKAVVKSGVQNASMGISDILNELPDAVNDFVEGAKGFLEGLGL